MDNIPLKEIFENITVSKTDENKTHSGNTLLNYISLNHSKDSDEENVSPTLFNSTFNTTLTAENIGEILCTENSKPRPSLLMNFDPLFCKSVNSSLNLGTINENEINLNDLASELCNLHLNKENDMVDVNDSGSTSEDSETLNATQLLNSGTNLSIDTNAKNSNSECLEKEKDYDEIDINTTSSTSDDSELLNSETNLSNNTDILNTNILNNKWLEKAQMIDINTSSSTSDDSELLNSETNLSNNTDILNTNILNNKWLEKAQMIDINTSSSTSEDSELSSTQFLNSEINLSSNTDILNTKNSSNQWYEKENCSQMLGINNSSSSTTSEDSELLKSEENNCQIKINNCEEKTFLPVSSPVTIAQSTEISIVEMTADSNKIMELNNEVTKSKEEIERLNLQLKESNDDCVNFKLQLKQLKSTNEAFEIEKNTYFDEISKLKSIANCNKMVELNKEVKESKEEIQHLTLQLSECQEKCFNFQLELNRLKNTNETLEMENTQLIKKLEASDPKERILKLESQVVALTSELQKCQSENQNYVEILKEYDEMMNKSASQLKDFQTEYSLTSRHLLNLEHAFSDVHQKYERCKKIIEDMKANEGSLLMSMSISESNLLKHEKKYKLFEAYATEQIQKCNHQLRTKYEQYDVEVQKFATIVKRLEIKNSSLQELLDQKTKECKALTVLCDEVTAKPVKYL